MSPEDYGQAVQYAQCETQARCSGLTDEEAAEYCAAMKVSAVCRDDHFHADAAASCLDFWSGLSCDGYAEWGAWSADFYGGDASGVTNPAPACEEMCVPSEPLFAGD